MSAIARMIVLVIPLFTTGLLAAGQTKTALVTMAGAATHLEEHTGDGKWLVVMLWSVSCGICAREVPVYSDFHDEHKRSDIKILGVALDGYDEKENIKNTMRRWDMRFPTLIADLKLFAPDYQFETGERLMGTPTFMVYTPEGLLVANNPGPMRTAALVDYIARRQAQK